MPDELDKKAKRFKRLKIAGFTLCGLYLFYVIAGFWIVPPLLKPRVEEQLTNLLGRKVTIDRIQLNPLLLTATTSNFTIYETDGEPFAGFEELFVNAQLSSIFRWAATVKEIRLYKPFGVLKLFPGNRMNIEDILAKFRQPSEAPKKEKGLPRALIERFSVVEGKATIENHLEKEPIREVFTPITFELQQLSTLEGREGTYTFVGSGPLGGRFGIEGKVSVNPVRVQGSFSTQKAELPHFWEHVKDEVSFQIHQGRVDTSGDYEVAIVDGQLEATLENGAFTLTDFQLAEKGKEEILIALPTFSIQGVGVALTARRIVIDQIRTADATIKSWFSADGSTELQRLFQPDIEKLTALKPSGTPDGETMPGQPWLAELNSLEVSNWKLVLDDVTGQTPIRETFTIDSFAAGTISTRKQSQGTYAFAGTGPSGGRYRLEGNVTVDPLWTQGRYSVTDLQLAHFWEHIKNEVSVEVAKGAVGASGEYTLALNEGAVNAQLDKATVALHQFELTEKGKQEVLIAIPTLTVEEIGADLKAREIRIGKLQTVDGRIKSWLSADGTFELQRLLLGDLEKWKARKADGEQEPGPTPGEPWQLSLDKMEVNNWGLDFEDRTLAKPAAFTVDQISAVLEQFSNQKESQGRLTAGLRLNRSGTASVKGTAGIDPLVADLTVSTTQIALAPFQPYVDEAVNAKIIDGSISSNGRMRYRHQDAKPRIRYEGEVSVEAVEIQDTAQTEDFFTLAQFKASGIALELLPNRLHTTDVLIDRPYARVTIDRNGMVNVVNAFAPTQKIEGQEEQQNLLQRLVKVLILQFKGPMPISVDRVHLVNFAGDFLDASVSPNYNTRVEFQEGTVEGLSSDPSARADFKIVGSIDQTATIESSGQMNPMNALAYTRVDLSLKGFELPPVSPYAGKFIGYAIANGTLQTKLKYTVEADQVRGDNVILIDQLDLGERVDSPDAIDLPIKLGIALLKDANGRISVQVPVRGNVKDPKFDVGDAITSALTGTINQAGEDPFSAITEIDGLSGEALRSIVFGFGSAVLNESEIKKLKALSTFLKDRTALTLGITGTAERNADSTAMAVDQPPADELPTAAGTAETAPGEETQEAPVAQPVDAEQLRQLARQRAETVRAYLTEQALLDAGRLALKPVVLKNDLDAQGGLVELSLSLGQ